MINLSSDHVRPRQNVRSTGASPAPRHSSPHVRLYGRGEMMKLKHVVRVEVGQGDHRTVSQDAA
jgi:hypothetical protein